jgi:hypothetical protein
MLLSSERTAECQWDYWLHWKPWDAGLAIHRTRPSLRRVLGFSGTTGCTGSPGTRDSQYTVLDPPSVGCSGSAGELTRAAGCSETRHGRVFWDTLSCRKAAPLHSLTPPSHASRCCLGASSTRTRRCRCRRWAAVCTWPGPRTCGARFCAWTCSRYRLTSRLTFSRTVSPHCVFLTVSRHCVFLTVSRHCVFLTVSRHCVFLTVCLAHPPRAAQAPAMTRVSFIGPQCLKVRALASPKDTPAESPGAGIGRSERSACMPSVKSSA